MSSQGAEYLSIFSSFPQRRLQKNNHSSKTVHYIFTNKGMFNPLQACSQSTASRESHGDTANAADSYFALIIIIFHLRLTALLSQVHLLLNMFCTFFFVAKVPFELLILQTLLETTFQAIVITTSFSLRVDISQDTN